MAKFALPKSKEGVTRSSLRVPSSMLARMELAIANSGYNRKQRSLWISDITEKFLDRSDAPNLIAEEFIVPGSTESIPVTLSRELDARILNMIDQVLQAEEAHTDRSSILRTAITQHLMAAAGMQLSPQETRRSKLTTGGIDDSHLG